MKTTKPATVLLIASIALAGCSDEGGSGDSAAFCEAIRRSEEVNPFGVTASGDREPDLELYLAGLEGMSAAYKDALAVVPSEIEEDFEALAASATKRYDEALAIEEPTGATVDAVIFSGSDPHAPSDELITYIGTECSIDFSD